MLHSNIKMCEKTNKKRLIVNQRTQPPSSLTYGLSTPSMSQNQQGNPAGLSGLQTPSTSQFAIAQMNQQQANSTMFTGFPMSQFSNLQMFAPTPQFSMDQGQINQFSTIIPAFMSFMNTMVKYFIQFLFADI